MTEANTTFKIAGGKAGVLLVHGLCFTPAELRFIAMGLGRAGYAVHCPLLAGHGGSRADIVKTGWLDWYQSAETALADLRKECDTVIVEGLSLGSIICSHLAMKQPEQVLGVALFSQSLRVNGWAMPWHTKLFGLVRHKRLATLGIKCPRVREFVRQAMANSDGTALGRTGTPSTMLLERRWMAKAAIV